MRRIVALAVSLAMLALLWWLVEPAAIWRAAAAADPLWLALGVAAVVPLTLATALRFRLISGGTLDLGLATRLTLSASTLNLVLPSKMGDLAKALVLSRRHAFDGADAVALVVFEKLLDLASLLLLGVIALLWIAPTDPLFLLGTAGAAALLLLLAALLAPIGAANLLARLAALMPPFIARRMLRLTDGWDVRCRSFWSRPGRAWGIVLLSVAIWAGHLGQFWLYANALAPVPLLGTMAAATLSILVGLAPFTMAGIGTRDAAILYFFKDWLSPGQAATLGLLATLRYVLPAIGGLPFMSDFYQKAEPGDAAAS
jgi:uncharacterized protein (TIRG00374 family)